MVQRGIIRLRGCPSSSSPFVIVSTAMVSNLSWYRASRSANVTAGTSIVWLSTLNLEPTPPVPWQEAQDCSNITWPAAAPVRTGAAVAAGAAVDAAPAEEHAPSATARIAPAIGAATSQRE